jgi:hypothetical protein
MIWTTMARDHLIGNVLANVKQCLHECFYYISFSENAATAITLVLSLAPLVVQQ